MSSGNLFHFGFAAVAACLLSTSAAVAQQTVDLTGIGVSPDGNLSLSLANATPGVAPTDFSTVGQLRGAVNYTDAKAVQAVNLVDRRMNRLTAGSNQGVASVAAMLTAIRTPSPGKSTVSVGGGYYGGQAGMAVAMAHRSRSSKWQTVAAIGVPASMVSGANIAASGGIGFEF